MDELLNLFKEYGAYVALPVIISFLMQGIKTYVPFFSGNVGQRLIHFIPLFLGMIGGVLLPDGDLQSKLLVGGGLGSVSHIVYKSVKVTLSKSSVAKIIGTPAVAEDKVEDDTDVSEV